MGYFKLSFFQQDTVFVARSLLGVLLVHKIGANILSGYIVETEAYCANDQACHAYRGKTPRNAGLFGPVAHAYVYISYGIHMCLNIVAHPIEQGRGGVLIRAVEPVDGIELMKKNRKVTNLTQLTSGPGKLTQAFGVTMQDNGTDILHNPNLFISQGVTIPSASIIASERIGISRAKEHLWRFYVKGNPFVSR